MDDKQRKISRLVVKTGQILLQHGAESHLVVTISRRVGLAIGADDVEVSLSASSLVISTVINEHCVTTTRRAPDRGINMKAITEVQHLCIMLEKGMLDYHQATERLNNISIQRYNRWVVAIMIGLSCASFSHLSGGDMAIFCMTFIASFLGMIVRQELANHHFNPLLNFGVTAFVTTLISSQAEVYSIGNTPFLVMASSVLMLVPGFPLINAVADMVKGYVNMGIARWVMASLLTLATSIGIVGAMNIVNVWGWVNG